MITISRDMISKCTPVDTDTFIREQKSLVYFIEQMIIRSLKFPIESLPGFYTLLVTVIYKLLKFNLKDMTIEDIDRHYKESQGIFIRTMWHEEFMDEQPQLYRLLVYFMDCCMEEPHWDESIHGVMSSYIRVMYSVLKENRGRY